MCKCTIYVYIDKKVQLKLLVAVITDLNKLFVFSLRDVERPSNTSLVVLTLSESDYRQGCFSSVAANNFTIFH